MMNHHKDTENTEKKLCVLCVSVVKIFRNNKPNLLVRATGCHQNNGFLLRQDILRQRI
jgi:hypothetical protein